MALPVTCGSYYEPANVGPKRTWIQNYKVGATGGGGALVCIGTIAAATEFRLMNLAIGIMSGTAGCAVSIELKGDPILQLSGVVDDQINLNFAPFGIKSDVVNTSTLKAIISSGTCTVSMLASGFYE